MKKPPLEVKEFDKITGNKEYKDDSNFCYLEEPAFDELKSFIEEYAASQENDDAYDCFKIIKKRGPGELVVTKNYVGLIQTKSGYQIQILPKISMGGQDDTNNRVTKNTFIKMLRYMSDFENKVISTANLNIDKMNLYEIFINMYIQQVIALVKLGLKSNYVSNEDNLSTLRGKLNINKHIIKNIAHKEKFYCNFDEYQINRPENKLIKTTLLKLYKITERIENKKSISQLLTSFELVEESKNYDVDFNKASIDRSMKDYELILKWSKVFLQNKSFTTFSGDTISRALLFPMDKLFEGYVAKNIKKVLSDKNWNVATQDKGYYLFDDPRQFRLRPDIVITRDNGTRIVLDTKWKSLFNNSSKNYGISQSDMYQMYAYAKKYKTNEVWLLYPLNDEMRNHSQISFESKEPNGNVEALVRLFFVDVTDIQSSLNELKMML